MHFALFYLCFLIFKKKIVWGEFGAIRKHSIWSKITISKLLFSARKIKETCSNSLVSRPHGRATSLKTIRPSEKVAFRCFGLFELYGYLGTLSKHSLARAKLLKKHCFYNKTCVGRIQRIREQGVPPQGGANVLRIPSRSGKMIHARVIPNSDFPVGPEKSPTRG